VAPLSLLDLRSILLRQQAVAELVHRTPEDARSTNNSAKFMTSNGSTAAPCGQCHPKDLLALRKSLELLPKLQENVQHFNSQRLVALRDRWDSLVDVTIRIAETLVDDPPLSLAGAV